MLRVFRDRVTNAKERGFQTDQVSSVSRRQIEKFLSVLRSNEGVCAEMVSLLHHFKGLEWGSAACRHTRSRTDHDLTRLRHLNRCTRHVSHVSARLGLVRLQLWYVGTTSATMVCRPRSKEPEHGSPRAEATARASKYQSPAGPWLCKYCTYILIYRRTNSFKEACDTHVSGQVSAAPERAADCLIRCAHNKEV